MRFFPAVPVKNVLSILNSEKTTVVTKSRKFGCQLSLNLRAYLKNLADLNVLVVRHMSRNSYGGENATGPKHEKINNNMWGCISTQFSYLNK